MDGVIVGRTNLPLAHEGDALFHIGRTGEVEPEASSKPFHHLFE